VAVVGGGSTYTPELVDSLCSHEDRVVVDELVLLDPDPDRLEAVGGMAGRILRARGWAGDLVTTDDRNRAIDGADFVVIQLRVGGQAARHTDETLPIGYGCLGQETTGPGGLAKALRTVPVVLGIAEETAARGADGAWVVDFTNPVGIVTQALLDEGHRAVGLCNVAIHVQRRIGRVRRGGTGGAIGHVRGGARHRRAQPGQQPRWREPGAAAPGAPRRELRAGPVVAGRCGARRVQRSGDSGAAAVAGAGQRRPADRTDPAARPERSRLR